MIEPVIMVIPIHLLLGIFIGILMDDREKIIGPNEFGVATLMFLIVSSTALFFGKPKQIVSMYNAILLCVGWASISIGLIIGNKIRFKFINDIVNNCTKKDIQLAVTSFLRTAQTYGYNGGEERLKQMNVQLNDLDNVINETMKCVNELNRFPSVLNTNLKLFTLVEICTEYANISKLVAEEEEPVKNKLVKEWLVIADDLIDHTVDTLSFTEKFMFESLRRLSTIDILRINILRNKIILH